MPSNEPTFEPTNRFEAGILSAVDAVLERAYGKLDGIPRAALAGARETMRICYLRGALDMQLFMRDTVEQHMDDSREVALAALEQLSNELEASVYSTPGVIAKLGGIQ